MINLFNAPPRESLSLAQRTGRIFLVSLTLIVASVLFAMLGAVGLYLMERGREMGDAPEFLNGLGIVLVGVGVNIACVFVLLQIKKADRRLIPPKDD